MDGWCYDLPQGGRVVRVNSALSKERQRFTLAHELAHFVLGDKYDSGPIVWDVYDSKSPQELEVNELASNFLLPLSFLAANFGGYSIDYATLKHLMKAAKVSDIAAALRLAKCGAEIGLAEPAVIWFENGNVSKTYPYFNEIDPSLALTLYRAASTDEDRTATIDLGDDTMIVASALPNANYQTLFVYHEKSGPLRRLQVVDDLATLKKRLYKGDDAFMWSLEGCIGGHLGRSRAVLLKFNAEERAEWIMEKFALNNPQHASKVSSTDGRRYLLLRMQSLK